MSPLEIKPYLSKGCTFKRHSQEDVEHGVIDQHMDTEQYYFIQNLKLQKHREAEKEGNHAAMKAMETPLQLEDLHWILDRNHDLTRDQAAAHLQSNEERRSMLTMQIGQLYANLTNGKSENPYTDQNNIEQLRLALIPVESHIAKFEWLMEDLKDR